MATEPKFRPSLTASELALIERALCNYLETTKAGQVGEAIETTKLIRTIQLFNFKIGNSHTQASYIPTGTAKPRVSDVTDLLSESEIAERLGLTGGVDYSSTTAMHTAYKNCMMAQSIGGNGTIEDQAASQKWIAYCDQNNLDYNTGEERS